MWKGSMQKVELDNGNIQLYLGDCLEIMPLLPPKSIDMVLADLPYGTTACKWDSIIPLDILWKQYLYIQNINAPVVLFAGFPFNITLGYSNIKSLRHRWLWNKKQSGSFWLVKKQPLRIIEDILVFCSGRLQYFPQMKKGKFRQKGAGKNGGKVRELVVSGLDGYTDYSDLYYPTELLDNFSNANKLNRLHPTQKPVALMEYLIKTYTNEGDLVLDNTMGSGTTGVAAIKTNRRFIGIEKEEKYFEIAVNRCKEAIEKKGNDHP